MTSTWPRYASATRQQARAEGYHRRYPYSAYFFEDWENELIPSPFDLVAKFAHQLTAASLIELQEMGVYEVIGTEPDLTAFQPERPVRSAARSAPQAPQPESPGQRHERMLSERIFRLEELGEPYSVCVICEVPLPAGNRCSCGTKLQPKIVRPLSRTPDNPT